MKRGVIVVFTALAVVYQAQAQMSFKNVRVRTSYASVEQGDRGRLIINDRNISFVGNGSKKTFDIPPDALTELFYSRVTGRRIKTAVAVAIVTMGIGGLLALSKGRKHYLTLAFDDDGDKVGAVEFQLHKSNYRGCLRALEQVSGLTLLYDQEGIKDEEQKPATRDE